MSRTCIEFHSNVHGCEVVKRKRGYSFPVVFEFNKNIFTYPHLHHPVI